MRQFIATLLVTLFATLGSYTIAHAACPAGKITCAQFCKNNPDRTNCMSGNANSCDKKPQGAQTCVGNNITNVNAPAGSCASRGMVTCGAWCAAHPDRTSCMSGAAGSCDRKPQGAQTCVRP